MYQRPLPVTADISEKEALQCSLSGVRRIGRRIIRTVLHSCTIGPYRSIFYYSLTFWRLDRCGKSVSDIFYSVRLNAIYRFTRIQPKAAQVYLVIFFALFFVDRSGCASKILLVYPRISANELILCINYSIPTIFNRLRTMKNKVSSLHFLLQLLSVSVYLADVK